MAALCAHRSGRRRDLGQRLINGGGFARSRAMELNAMELNAIRALSGQPTPTAISCFCSTSSAPALKTSMSNARNAFIAAGIFLSRLLNRLRFRHGVGANSMRMERVTAVAARESTCNSSLARHQVRCSQAIPAADFENIHAASMKAIFRQADREPCRP